MPLPPRLFACALVAAAAPVALGQPPLPPAKLKAIKAATVLVEASVGPNKSGTGSGFVLRVDGKTVYAVTNHHVIAHTLPSEENERYAWKPEVRLVFDSGTPAERSAAAEVVALDPGYDLAVLKAAGVADPPAPFDMSARPEVAETAPVLVCGFPYGKVLAAGAKRPGVTVGKATVSGIRRSPAGDPLVVQLDGALNPGNSGGPVVTADGGLVGVAVAGIFGSGIGLAIPRERVDDVLAGRIAVTGVQAVEAGPDGCKVRLTAAVADPFGKVRSPRLYVRDGRYGDPPPVAKDGAGKWPRMAGAARHDLKDPGLTRTLTLTRPTVRRPVWVQPEYDLPDGTTVRGPAEEYSPQPIPRPDEDDVPDAAEQAPGVRPGTPKLPPPPEDGASLLDLAKTPDRFQAGKPVVVHALLQKHVSYPRAGSVGRLMVNADNGTNLPIEVVVPRAVGLDLSVADTNPGTYQHAARLTLVRVPDAKALGTAAPVFAATEVALFDENQEVGKTFKADGDLDAFLAEVRASYQPPAPPPPPTATQRVRKWADEVSVWTVASLGLLAFGVVAVGVAVLTYVVRAVRSKKGRGTGRRFREDEDDRGDGEGPDDEDDRPRPRQR